jgi:hypothetical protein
MLSIRIGSDFLDLFPDTSLNVSGVSPVFDRDRIERVFSYPVKVPVNENNQALLGYPSRLDAARQRRYENVTVFLEGIEFDRGIFKLSGVANDIIELTFQNAPLDYIEQLKRKKLQEDLDMPVTAASAYTPTILITTVFSTTNYGNQSVAIGVDDNVYTEPTSSAQNIINLINADYAGLASVDNYDDSLGSGVILTLAIDTSVDPTIQLNLFPFNASGSYVFFELLLPQGISAGTLFTEWQAHVTSVNSTSTTHAFPPVYAPRFYDDRNDRFSGFLNYIAPDGSYPHDIESISDNNEGWTHTFLPMPYLKHVVEQIFDAVGITVVAGSFFDDTNIQSLLVYNLRALDINLTPYLFISKQVVENNAEIPIPSAHGYPSTYNLRDHLPDTSLYEFIQRLSTTFPLVIRIEQGAVYIDDVDTLINQVAIDLTEYADPEYSLDISTSGGYRLTYDRQDTPEATTTVLTDLINEVQDLDPVEIQTGFFTNYVEYVRDTLDLNGRIFRLPFEQGVGESILAQVDEETPFKLLFSFFDTDTSQNSYISASYNQVSQGNQVIGPYSLDWNGTDGLYDHWWRKLIDLLSADEIDVTVYLPFWKLIELRQNITAAIQIQYPEGKVIGYVKKYQFKIGLRTAQHIPVRITLAKL